MKRTTSVLTLLLAAAAQPVIAANSSSAWQQLSSDLLAREQYVQAYELLLPLLDAQAGNPDYDYLFGQAARGTGQHTESVMAFERCLLMVPAHSNCRLGIAQAYMALAEHNSARQELQELKSAQLEEGAAQMVEEYLGQLHSAQPGRGKPRYIGWLEMTTGHDSNSNYAPNSSHILLPDTSNYPGYSYRTARDATAFTRLKGRLAAQIPVAER